MSETIVSAFAGALFAFLFMCLWSAIDRYDARWNRHYTGVVKLSRATNEQLASIHSAIFEISEIIDAYTDARDHPGTIPISVNQPEAIAIDSTFEYDIVNLDLVNEFAKHRYNVQCANRDIQRLVTMKDNLEKGFAEGRLTPENYLLHFEDLAQWLSQLRKSLDALLDDTTTLTARARVRAQRDAPMFHSFSMKLRRTRHEKDFEATAAREREILLEEIGIGSAKSGLRAEAISRGTYNSGDRPDPVVD